jgi:5-methylcytosine-specific restriction endonuclease McrA
VSGQALSCLTYSEWLASPRFKEIRKEAIARADGRCQVCNNSMGLETHHREYSTLGTPEEIENVIILCDRCHKLFSGRLPTAPASAVRSASGGRYGQG